MTVADKIAELMRAGITDTGLLAEGAGTTRNNAWNVKNRINLRTTVAKTPTREEYRARFKRSDAQVSK